MLRAHSYLWNYLWPAPNVLLIGLAYLLWRRGLHKRYPFFFVFAIVSGLEQLTVYITDVIPSVRPETWWQIFRAGFLIECLLKFGVIGEVFAHVFDPYPSVAKLGKFLIRGVGVVLVVAGALLAALAPQDSPYGVINGSHLLEQTSYLIASGLLLSVFLLSAYFHLGWKRPVFGIGLGLAVSACVHLATWGVADNLGLPASKRVILDFVNMGTYHACVLIWYYYLLLPEKAKAKPPDRPLDSPAVGTVEEDLNVWNQEVERLLHR